MKSRLVILTMLVLGMLLSTAGAGLAVSGIAADDASNAQYGPDVHAARRRRRPRRRGRRHRRRRRTTTAAAATQRAEGDDVQPARQVEAGANDQLELPFTGFAAVPVLLGGVALLSAGLVLRRRTGEQR